jgi:hypothetical protein
MASFTDGINIPLCLSVGALTASVVAVAIYSTEAVYNYVDRSIIYSRYNEMDAAGTTYWMPIKKGQYAKLDQPAAPATTDAAGNPTSWTVPIDTAKAALVQSKGVVPTTQPR